MTGVDAARDFFVKLQDALVAEESRGNFVSHVLLSLLKQLENDLFDQEEKSTESAQDILVYLGEFILIGNYKSVIHSNKRFSGNLDVFL